MKIGEVATTEYLDKELAIVDRLNGMIARALKSLLYLRGIKTLPPAAKNVPTKTDKDE